MRIFFFIGWHSVFEKIIGWLLIGFFKIKKMLGCGMIGFSILIKIIGWEYSVSTFLSKNARLDFNRFFVKKQKLLGWALIGSCFFFILYSVEGYCNIMTFEAQGRWTLIDSRSIFKKYSVLVYSVLTLFSKNTRF